MKANNLSLLLCPEPSQKILNNSLAFTCGESILSGPAPEVFIKTQITTMKALRNLIFVAVAVSVSAFFVFKSAKDSGLIDLASGLINAHNISAEKEKERLANLTPEQRAQEHQLEIEREKIRIERTRMSDEADKLEAQRRSTLTADERLREDEAIASRKAKEREAVFGNLRDSSKMLLEAQKEENKRRANLSREERAREDAMQRENDKAAFDAANRVIDALQKATEKK